jgi:hypothetical protein
LFPELAWKYGKLAKGAVVIDLQPGVLQELGLAEHSVVLAVDGRETGDADAFVKIVSEEHAMLADRGGAFRLLVQADNGDPREFSKQLAGKQVDVVPDKGDGKHHHGEHTGGNNGGVNVWDRFGGNRGSGRDDPTQ